MGFAYGFNHAAAVQSFREAQKADPDCAICYWGEALPHGPNINAPMDPATSRAPSRWRATPTGWRARARRPRSER